MLKNTKCFVCFVLSPVGLLALTSCSSKSGASQSPDPAANIRTLPGVAATVNGQAINTSDVVGQALVDDGPSALGQLIDFKVLDQAASLHHIQVTRTEITAKRSELISSLGADNYASEVSLHRINPDFVDEKVKHEIILEKLTALELPQQHLMLHVRQILIATKPTQRGVDLHKPHCTVEAVALVARIQTQLKNGADFADLARKYSEDPYTRASGGDLGIIDQHSDPFDGTIWNAATGLKNGQISPQSAHSYLGFHLVQVVSWSTSPLSSDKQDYLNLQKRTSDFEMTRMMNGTMARLRNAANIQEELYGPNAPSVTTTN